MSFYHVLSKARLFVDLASNVSPLQHSLKVFPRVFNDEWVYLDLLPFLHFLPPPLLLILHLLRDLVQVNEVV